MKHLLSLENLNKNRTPEHHVRINPSLSVCDKIIQEFSLPNDDVTINKLNNIIAPYFTNMLRTKES